MNFPAKQVWAKKLCPMLWNLKVAYVFWVLLIIIYEGQSARWGAMRKNHGDVRIAKMN